MIRCRPTTRCSGQPLRICKCTPLAKVKEESGAWKINRLKSLCVTETLGKRRALASCAPSRSRSLPLRNGVAAELGVGGIPNDTQIPNLVHLGIITNTAVILRLPRARFSLVSRSRYKNRME